MQFEMERVIAALCLLSVCSAKVAPPTWFDGVCGKSKYPDAGDHDLPSASPRMIVGGIPAKPNELPWQVSLRAGGRHFCGGSIINERWIVSAAHCFLPTGAPFDVAIGEHKRSDTSSTVRQIRSVEKLITHEQYGEVTNENDIALIKVTEDITFSEDVAPICPPNPNVDYTHKKCITSGWGYLKFAGFILSDTLQYTSLNVTTNEFCRGSYAPQNLQVTDDMVCASDNAGGIERDSCQGDSGGPLAVKGEDGTFSLLGVVSWGIGCASGYPGVYQNIQHQLKWISDTIAEK